TLPDRSASAIQQPGGAPSRDCRAAPKSATRSTAIPPPSSERETSGLLENRAARVPRSAAARANASRRSAGGAAGAVTDGGDANQPSAQSRTARAPRTAATRPHGFTAASVKERQVHSALARRGDRFRITGVGVPHDAGSRIGVQDAAQPPVGVGGSVRDDHH